MARKKVNRRPQVGARPGTLVPGANPTRIDCMRYGPTNLKTQKNVAVKDIVFDETQWIEVTGLENTTLIRELTAKIKLHDLILEDIINHPQRPKVEFYQDHVFVLITTITPDHQFEQVSLVFGKNYLMSFADHSISSLNTVRQRLENPEGRMRTMGADYLAYAIIDTLIDAFLPALDEMGEKIDTFEKDIVARPREQHIESIGKLKGLLLKTRRIIWPLRDAVLQLVRQEDPHVSPQVRVYLRDCSDHVTHCYESIESFREAAGSLLTIYMSTVNNRTNDIMKVLTIMSTIFIPLNFIAGVYGMNFEHMPELSWSYGYPLIVGLMALIAAGMLVYFAKQGWFGTRQREYPNI